jgi:hypothetical protein
MCQPCTATVFPKLLDARSALACTLLVDIDIPGPGGGCSLVGGLQREKLSSTVVLYSGVPLFGVQASPVFRVPLPKNVFAPVAEVCLGKVEKKPRFFSTFSVHPCSFMTFRELMAMILDRVLQLVSERHKGSMRVRTGQVGSWTPVDS